jgi:CBS domain-containing protein
MHNAAIRHLGVTDDRDVVVGAITSGDLLRQRAEDALNMGVTLDQAGSVESLAKIWGRLPTVARSLLNEDVAVTHIAAVISDQLATLTRRAAELAEQQMRERGHGAPPTKYAVLLLGSGGRGETLLAPDQDNALVYEDGNENAETWFAEFGQIMSETLDVVGVPYCKGGVMASNAQWRHSVSNWKKTVRDWLGRAEWEDLCYVDIFYDFSFVFGDHTLARDLREYAYALSGKAPGFIRQLSALATMYDPPINIFGILKTENGRADLKHGGALPIVSGARVLALNYGISESATRRRLRGARKLGIADSDDLEAVEEAHSILLRAILEQQLIDLETGVEPSNSVDVKRLSKRKRLAIKGALKRIEIIKTVVGDPMAFG